ncbi:hypothetical protein [Sphaerisporangium sp. TRM90804]|uniref:hypothetical protein n=1 Tax=Sphaerisporangium sp. TRM90804 TaxID=3031113 RepID=UPI00244C636A|nr:hypothetical protein [Sphaerisporangium sp. TRM90804]MDH2429085.1 hypothetical protein [Sphaerisporangium sp. TRM90804]
MGARHNLGPVMASGTATAARLLIASLTMAGAYLGVEAATGTEPSARVGARTVTLSAQAMPVEVERAPRTGTVSVAASAAGPECRRTYHAQGVAAPEKPGAMVTYDWTLYRWSPRTKEWMTYLSSGPAGFIGGPRAVEWRPRVVGNPGWYRVELEVSGEAAVLSERFQVSC